MDSIYSSLGGEETLRRLVDAFYDHMDSNPAVLGIRKMHPPDLAGSREKLYLFLVGWSGGPQLYVERYGHPRLRSRHLGFPIGTAQAIAWMHCMQAALNEVVEDEALRKQLEEAFVGVAAHMRNRQDD